MDLINCYLLISTSHIIPRLRSADRVFCKGELIIKYSFYLLCFSYFSVFL